MKRLKKQSGFSLLLTALLGLFLVRDVVHRVANRAVFRAIHNADADAAARALIFGASPNATAQEGEVNIALPGDPALVVAASINSTDICKSLIQAGANVNALTNAHDSSLAMAIANCNVVVVHDLLQAGANPNQPALDPGEMQAIAVPRVSILGIEQRQNEIELPIRMTAYRALNFFDPHIKGANSMAKASSSQRTIRAIYDMLVDHGAKPALVDALSVRDFARFRALLSSGADINASDKAGLNPVRIAVQMRDTALLTELLNAGADATVIAGERSAFSVATENRESLLTTLIVDHAVKRLRQNKPGAQKIAGRLMANVSERPQYLLLRSACVIPNLQTAIRFADVEAIKYLLSHGTSPNLPFDDSAYPLEQAGPPAVVKCLLERGADPNKCVALRLAVETANSVKVSLLLDAGAKLAPRSSTLTVTEKRLMIERSSLNKGYLALERQTGGDGPMPLIQIAAEMGSSAIYGELKKHGAVANLYIAAAMGDLGELKRLRAKGEDLDALNSLRQSAIGLALIRRHWDAAEWLLKAGASADILQLDGQTPLTFCVKTGDTRGLQLLLEHKADPKRSNDRGETPLNLAVKLKNVKLEQILRQYGA